MEIQKFFKERESTEDFADWTKMSRRFEANLELLPLAIDLKKLLVEVTGEKDVENLSSVKLKVVTRQAGLHRLAEYTPRLKILILDDSCVDSLRDLGSSMKFLESLSVCRCSLNCLDGLWGLPRINKLLARGNKISDISPCSGVDKLVVLDVAENEIKDLSSFIYLEVCKRLRILNVFGNHFNDYSNTLTRLLPQIQFLDGEDVTAGRNLQILDKNADNEISSHKLDDGDELLFRN